MSKYGFNRFIKALPKKESVPTVDSKQFVVARKYRIEEIKQLKAQGYTRKEMADILGLSLICIDGRLADAGLTDIKG